MAAVLLGRAVFGGQVLFERDIHVVWVPQVEAIVRAIGAGAWPLWDPTVCFGQPLLADPSAQVAYPPAWVNLLLPPGRAYTALAAGHLVFAGLGAYVLARRLGLGTTAALAAAVVWEAGGPLVSLVNVWHHFAGAAWMPWVLAAAHGLFAAPGPRRALVCAGAVAGQILAGSADMCAMTALLAVLDGARTALRATAGRRALVLWVAAAWALAVAVTAVQWMPTLEVARRSARWGLPEPMRTAWSAHPLALAQAVVPVPLHELPLRADVQERLVGRREPFLLSIYLGLPALVLVAFAAGRPHARFVALLGLAAALVALGSHAPFYDLAVTLVPPARILRYPMKALIVSSLAWALLAGIGVDAWRAGARPCRWPLAGALVVGALAAVAGLWLRYSAGTLAPWFEEAEGHGLSALLGPHGERVLLAVLLAAAVAILARMRTTWPVAAPAVALGLVVLDLAATQRAVNPTAPPTLYRYRPPVVDVLREVESPRVYVYEYLLGGRGHLHVRHPDPRVEARLRADPFVTRRPSRDEAVTKVTQALAYQAYLMPPIPGRWGLAGAYDVDVRGLYPRSLAELTTFLRQVEETPAHDRLLRIGGVTHVLALHDAGFERLQRVAALRVLFVPDLRVFHVPDPLPRAYVVPAARVTGDGEATLHALVEPSFDPRREVLLAEAPTGAGARHAGTGAASPAAARIVDSRADRVRVEVRAPDGGYLVLLDAYDPGWRATVDGVPAPVLRANHAFRAVAVPPGTHFVEQVYRPRGLRLGIAVTVAALAGFLAAAVVVSSRSWRSLQGT